MSKRTFSLLVLSLLFGVSGAGQSAAQFPPPRRERVELVERFDRDGDGRLNDAERAEARRAAAESGAGRGRGRRPPFFGPGGGRQEEEGETGEAEKVSPHEVKIHSGRGLYEPDVLRTFFLRFPGDGWESELSDFYGTDVEVPADLTVDGKTYRDVGVRFRGNSSYFMVPAGRKRSFNISVDHAVDGQRLLGYRTLNLLNSHADPTFLREILFSRIARDYLPAPRANLVKVVINGESWGIYVNVQQFNNDLVEEWFGTRDGVRWKVPPGRGVGALIYEGDAPEIYQRSFQLKTEEDAGASWAALIRLTKLLDETPVERRVEVLDPVFNLDRALWFIALDNVFTDGDGYISRGSDYSLFRDPSGRFHVLPHDSNETFGLGRGPGRGPGGGRGGRGPGGFGRGPRGGGPGGGFGPPPDPLGRALDTDEDGEISAAEIQNAVASLRDLDANGDGAIDVEESRPPPPPDSFLPGGRPGGGPGGRFGGGVGGGPGAGFGPPTESLRLSPLILEDSPDHPVISKLLAVPELRARYLAHVRTIAEEWLDWSAIEPLIEEYRTALGDEIAKDTRKLYTTESHVRGITEEVAGGRRPVPGLKSFVDGRRAFLLGHPALSGPRTEVISVESSIPAGSSPGAEDRVSVRARIGGKVKSGVVLLHYSGAGAAPYGRVEMPDDGNHGDGAAGDGVHGAEIPAFPLGTLVHYYVEARAAPEGGMTVFHPARAEAGPLTYLVNAPAPASSGVRINELMAMNRSSRADPQGELDDWIELFNPTGESVDLSELYLSDDPKNPRKWKFPDGTMIDPGGYRVVWADGDGTDHPGLHASFKLPKEGGQILLVDADRRGNRVLDRVVFGGQRADTSLGRVPDGSGWFRALRGTPGGTNGR